MSHALETGDFSELPDPRLGKNYNEAEMFRMIETAAACVRHSAPMRPRMGQVILSVSLISSSFSKREDYGCDLRNCYCYCYFGALRLLEL